MNIPTNIDIRQIFLYFYIKNVYIIVLGGRIVLKNRRKKLGIKQKELAKRLNVTQSYLSKIEREHFSNVNVEFIGKISEELKLDPVDVFLFFYKNL